MWVTCFGLLTVILIWQAVREGPYRALGCTVVLSMLVPTWVVVEVAGFPVDMRIAISIAALAVYCVHPRAVIRTPLVVVDFLGIALLAVHLLSDWTNEGFRWSSPLQAYGEWAVPYLAGRQACRTWGDIRWLTPIVVAVCLVLSMSAAIETVARINIFELIFGQGDVEGIVRHSNRWGWKRAIGPLRNPIYFGTLQLLLFPWTLYAAALAFRRLGPRWWFAAPSLIVGGILCSLSRAPLLGLAPLLYTVAIVLLPRWRRSLIFVGVVGGVVMITNYPVILESVSRLGNEAPSGRRATIIVGSDKVEYTNTYHRLYLFNVYGEAMKRAGLLGFGTDRTSVFPPQVPIGPEHTETLRRLWSIDNAYILLVLRFGYMGLIVFVMLALAAAISYMRLASRSELPQAVYAAGMAGSLVATMFVLMTVWMPHDFGFWFMWIVGAVAGLYASDQLPDDTATQNDKSKDADR